MIWDIPTRPGSCFSGRGPIGWSGPQRQFIIDGEAVLLAFTGISDFDGLHSRRHDEEVQLYAFDILAMDGDDLRRLPLSMRKQKLSRLLFRPPRGAASLRHHLSKARSVRTCSGRRAVGASRASCRSGLIGPIAPADRRIGSRSAVDA